MQPFLKISDSVRIIYNMDENDYQYLESSYAQLKYGHLCINSQDSSALNIVESLNEVIIFVEGLKRAIPLFYMIPLLCFCPQFIFWLRGIEILPPRQMGLLALLYQLELFLILYVRLEMPASDCAPINRKNIKIINKRFSLFLYALTILVVILTQLMHSHSYLIPEVPDPYDALISNFNLDPTCKYSALNNRGVTNTFSSAQCSPNTGKQFEEMFSRLSQMMVVYIQICIVLIVVLRSRNWRSWIVVVEYVLHVGTVVWMVFRGWTPAAMYPWGMSLTQWVIVMCLSLVTCGMAGGIAWALDRWSVSEYFEDELESSIWMEKSQNTQHYSSVLKEYHHKMRLH